MNRKRPRSSGLARDETGMVTVEAAVALAAFCAVLMFGIGAVVTVLGQIRCVDAAREVARLVARGDADRAGEAVRRIAPSSASFEVHTLGSEITVHVYARPLGVLPGLRNDGMAYAIREPSGA